MSKRKGAESEQIDYPDKSTAVAVTSEDPFIISAETQTSLSRPRYFNELTYEERRKLTKRMEENIESGYGNFEPSIPLPKVAVAICAMTNLIIIILSSNPFKNLNLRYEIYEVVVTISALVFVRSSIYIIAFHLDKRIFITYLKKIREASSR